MKVVRAAASQVKIARPERGVDIVRLALDKVDQRLPERWQFRVREEVTVGDGRLDAVAELTAPDRSAVTFVVEAKGSPAPGALPQVLEQLRSYRLDLRWDTETVVPLVVARYLGSSARAWLEERDVSYADATGNLHLVVDRPAFFLHDRGADSDPWRGPGRPQSGLVGPPSARVVRALVDFRPPVSVPELIRRAGTSTGATYRVVEFLEREGLLTREPRGPIVAVEWRSLIERWSEDYGFQSSNTIELYLEPRGLGALAERLRASGGLRYAVTGSAAAAQFAPYADQRLAMVYVDDLRRAAEMLRLRPVESGGNVLLASGRYDVIFERTRVDSGTTLVAPSQAAVDLLTAPGRGPAEAQALLDWMERHERDWRR